MRDLRLTAKMGRTVDFLVGDYSLADVNEIARLKIILDHLGGVQLDGGPHDKEWLSGFRTVAKHPNVYCKLSALYGRFKEQRRDGSGETKAGEKLLAMKRIRPAGGVAVSPPF